MKYDKNKCQSCGASFGTFDARLCIAHNAKCYRKCNYFMNYGGYLGLEYNDYLFYSNINDNTTKISRMIDGKRSYKVNYDLATTINRFINPNTVSNEDLDKLLLLI